MKCFFVLLLISISVSCSRTPVRQVVEPDSLMYIKIERPDFSKLKPLLMSDFVDSIRYIQLETTTKALLPKEESGGVVFTLSGNLIFSAYRGQLYQFDTQGNFIRQTGRIGRGPGEFELMRGRYALDEVNKKIFVTSRFSDCCPSVFDFDGKYLGVVRDSTLSSCWGMISMFEAGNGYIIFAPFLGDSKSQKLCRPYELIVFDYEKNEIVQSLTNRMIADVDRVHHDVTSGLRLLQKQGDRHFYKAFYNDTLYAINKDNIQPHAIIDLGARRYHPDLMYSNDPVKPRPGRVGKMLISDVFVHHQYFLFNCSLTTNDNMTDSEWFICKYDIATGAVSYHSVFFANDLDGGANIFVEDLSRGVRAVPYPDDDWNKDKRMSNVRKSDLKFPERKDQFEQMQQRLKENDNPVLMTWRLK